MAKKKGTSKKKNKNNENSSVNTGGNADGGGILVDPARVRFQHARIRPVFSGCGRSVEGTLEEIRQGRVKPDDLPPIQVLVGPIEKDTGEPWYFSLNNRRLWVLKRCREEGLLHNNQIYARVRKPKSEQEKARYTVENCALEAKLMLEKPKDNTKATTSTTAAKKDEELNLQNDTLLMTAPSSEKQSDEESEEDSDSSDDEPVVSNRFSALL